VTAVLIVLLLLAALVGGALVAVLTVAARSRRSAGPVIDPFTVQEPWRRAVQDAVKARNRFQVALGRMKSGPVKDQMADVGRRLEQAVQAAWAVAQQGHAIDRAYRDLDPTATRSRLLALESGAPDADDAALAALRSQLAAAERLQASSVATQQRLRVLTSRLDEAAAHALELSVSSAGQAEAAQISAALQDVTDELGSLRLALEETTGG
jgi:hypothetical protein